MRTGKELLLATKEFAKEDRYKSWVYTISTLILLMLMFAGTVWIVNTGLRIICSVLAALLMVRMFVIYHDYLHSTILQKSLLAKVIMTVYGLFVLNPSSIWKRSHNYHHKHNSKLLSASIGSYPIMTRQRYLNASVAERFSYLAVRHPLTILCGYIFMFLYAMCIQPFISHPRRHFDCAGALLIHISLITLVYMHSGFSGLLLSIILPFFISSALGAYLFYAQHNFPGVVFSPNEDWNYFNAATESSSYMVMNPVMRWFTGNIGYHHIHHLNAHIPFYRLPEAMRSIPELQKVTRTTLSPVNIWHCFQLKIWDPELNKMTGVRHLKQSHQSKTKNIFG